MKQFVLNGSVGGLGAIGAYMFGEWTPLLSIFFVVIVVDIISGVAASINEKRGLNSIVGSVGLTKKVLMIIAIMLAHRFDVMLGTAFVKEGAIYFYMANELLSIVENYGRCGLKLPSALRKYIEVLQQKGGAEDVEKPANKEAPK